ncbi:MAG: tetraacyldisaccharide 4'-kinase [Pseudomonadota bacterium]|jgi:tetraacyldisaccharide 4'-kinase
MPRFDTDRHFARLSLRSGLLLPLSWLYRLAGAARRFAYRAGWLRSYRMPVPVVVIGNVSVGGTGKTPLAVWVVRFLRARGWTPGVVSRGYGGSASNRRSCEEVTATSDPARVGDEPVLIARHAAVPVWIGVDRAFAAQSLLRSHPECDVLIADDGLQHYRLAREVEIAVIDAALGFGNRRMLPSGPLREPASRLRSVDALVVNGAPSIDAPVPEHAQFEMRIAPTRLYRLDDPSIAGDPASLRATPVHAVAGIGYPRRFFDLLRQMGFDVQEHPLPDHHVFTAADLEHGSGPVILTEKDAVKCRAFAQPNHWVLAVEAQLQEEFGTCLLRALRKSVDTPPGHRA